MAGCLNHANEYFTAGFHFTNNSNTTFSYNNCPATEVKEKMLRNMSELLAYQYCHLSIIYNMGGITSHSTLIHRISKDGKELNVTIRSIK